MPKGKVTQRFQDKNDKQIYGVGDDYQTTSTKRLNELIALGFVAKTSSMKDDA